jgi:hypothetical protein
MQMLGQTIEARSPFSPWIIFYVALMAALVAWAILAANPHPLIAAALPLGIAFGLVLGRPQRTVLLVDREGLRLFGAHEMIYFDEINAITVGGRELGAQALSILSEPMEIHYQRGVLVVPPLTGVDFTEFHNFLQSQIPPQPPRPVPSVLADYLTQQIAKFGPDKVSVIQTRRDFTERWRRKRRKWVSAGIFLAGLTWFVTGIVVLSTNKRADEYGGWVALGFILGFGGILGYFAPHSLRRNQTGRLLVKHPDACLIVAPPGIALVQGDTKGALPWNEITKISRKFSQWGRARQVKGLQLRVRGAEIIIFDIYDRTPAEIEQLLRRNLDLPIA